MTDSAIATGSCRARAACAQIVQPNFVVNLQGDSPFQPKGALGSVIEALDAGGQVATQATGTASGVGLTSLDITSSLA